MFMDWMATRKHPTHVFAGGTPHRSSTAPHLWYGDGDDQRKEVAKQYVPKSKVKMPIGTP